MRTHWGIFGSALLLCVGCFSGANVKGKHAKFHGCEPDDVSVQEVDSDGHTELRTSGCGRDETYFCIGMKCRSPRLLSISQFEAAERCNEKQITAEPKGDMLFALSGCGKTQTYECRQIPRDVLECTSKE